MPTPIPLAAKQLVYRVLSDEFPFDQPIPMATVAKALMDAGVEKEAYGHTKLKAFLAEMGEFLEFTDIVAGGVPQRLVTVKKREDWASAPAPDAPAMTALTETATTTAQTALPTRDKSWTLAGSSGASGMPAVYDRATAPVDGATPAQAPVPSAIPRGIYEELRPELSDFVYLPSSTLEILRTNAADVDDVRTLLQDDWRTAFADGRLRYYEGKVFFPLSVLRSDGTTPIEASIRHVSYENPEEKPWYLCYIDSYVRPAQPASQLIPSKELERFAWLGPWEAFLDELASLALPEAWDFECPDEPSAHRNVILKSYICTTFYRLKLEDKVCVDDAARFAAFNTGLVNRRYDDIYACFEPGVGTIPWKFSGFCTGGARGLGKQLVSLFNPLPEPASYFGSKDDLLFDLERELIIDFDHILIDNLERLPVAFLEEELHSSPEGLQLARAVRESDGEDERADALADLADFLLENDRMFRRLRWRLSDAVELARKRVRWNYKTAIPSYYPRANAMSLLLPLCLLDDEHADAALVVQLMPSGNYQGQTILTMQQAYTNARLICRPDSDWLSTAGTKE